MTLATQGLQQPRDTGLVLHHQFQHPLVAVRAMVPTIARGDVPDLFVRRLRALRPALDMNTRRSEMAERTRQPQPCGRRRGNEAVECRHPKVVEGTKGAPERVIMEMARLQAWGHEAGERLILEKMGDEVALSVEKGRSIRYDGLDCMPGGHNP